MATTVGELVVPIEGDLSGLEDSVNEVSSTLDSLGQDLQSMGKTLTKRVTAPIAGVGAALGGLVKTTADYADEIDKMSRRTGIGSDRLQELRFAAQQSGASLDTLDAAVSSFSRSLTQVDDESGRSFDALQELGVQTEGTGGQMRDMGSLVEDTLMRLADMEDSTRRAALGTQLFGRGFRELIPLLENGSAGIDDLTQQAQDLGIVMDDDSIGAFVRLKDAGNALWQQLRSVGQELAEEMLPVVQTLFPAIEAGIDVLGRAVRAFGGLSDGVKVTIAAIAGLVAVVGPVLGLTGAFVSAISGLAPVVTAAGVALKGLAITIAGLSAPIIGTIAVIGALGAAYIALGGDISDISDMLLNTFKAAWEQVVNVLDGAIRAIGDAARIVTSVARGDWSAAWEALKDLAMRPLEVLQDNFVSAMRFVTDGAEVLAGAFGVLEEEAASASAFFDDMERGADDSALGFDKMAESVQGLTDDISIFQSDGDAFDSFLRDSDENAQNAAHSVRALSGGVGRLRESLNRLEAESAHVLESIVPDADEIATQQEDPIFGPDGLISSDNLQGIEDLEERVKSFGEQIEVAFLERGRRSVGAFVDELGDTVGALVTAQGGVDDLQDAIESMARIGQRLIQDLISQLIRAAILSQIIPGGGGAVGAASGFSGGFALQGPSIKNNVSSGVTVSLRLDQSVTSSGDLVTSVTEGQRRRARGSGR